MPQYISKLILNGATQMDVTQDTVAANNLLSGETATGADGAPVVGTYTPPTSNEFTVVLAYNNVTQRCEPTCTYAEISAADSAGKDIYTSMDAGGYLLADGYWDSLMNRYVYVVCDDASASTFRRYSYTTGNVVTLIDEGTKYYTGDADATAADVRSGKVFYNANGQQTGSATVRTSSDLTASGDTVTAPAGFYASAATKSVASGTAGTPTASKGAVSNHSVSVTPSVTNTTGYITGGTKTGTAVTVSASELVSGSETKTANGTYDVTNLASLVVNVSGGGSSKNVQAYIGYDSRKANSYGATGVTLTVAKTGTYTISWCAGRGSSQGTMGTNLYKGNTSGTNEQTWTGTYWQNIKYTGQSLTQGQVLTLYATSGSTSRSIYVGNLVIAEE